MDQATGGQIAERLVQIGGDLRAARALAAKASAAAQKRMQTMIAAIA